MKLDQLGRVDESAFVNANSKSFKAYEGLGYEILPNHSESFERSDIQMLSSGFSETLKADWPRNTPCQSAA